MRILMVLAFLAISFLALGQDRIVQSSYFTADNAYQHSVRQYMGYEKNMAIKSRDTSKPPMMISVTPSAGWRCYFFEGAVTRYADARITASYRRGRRFSSGISASQLYSKEWSPLFFDGYARYSFGRASMEGYFERESVGTPITNMLRYSMESVGASVDFRITRKQSFVAGMTRIGISDGNVRWAQTARYIYLFSRNSYADFRTKRIFGSEWSPYYFSPNSIVQANLGYGFYSDLKNDGSARIYVGAGIQEIEGYVMSMFSIDAKASFKLAKGWSCDAIVSTRNFNDYLYHTLTIKLGYDLKKKAIPNR